MSSFSPFTQTITKKLGKKEKKEYGIFMTPKSILQNVIKTLETCILEKGLVIQDVLEPSCGSCEMIQALETSVIQYSSVTGIEWNPTLYDAIKGLTFQTKTTLLHANFLQYNTNYEKKYDLILGNPPYFVCKKENVSPSFQKWILGRPNIFGIFLLHSMEMLREGGILAFVVPKSFLNSHYYSKIRRRILETCTLLSIVDYEKNNDFLDTEQSTFGLFLQKDIKMDTKEKNNNSEYCISLYDEIIFTPQRLVLEELFQGSTTLQKMGLKVRTGNIVWNQHKPLLSNDPADTLLLYNTNIDKKNDIQIRDFGNPEKKQYIKKEGRIVPTLVVNRGNGNSKYRLQYAIVHSCVYLVENHLNEIYCEEKKSNDELIALYKKIVSSFENPKTQIFIDCYLGNNSLSKTELESIFPIYLSC
jgi:type I restriction-modification system DNA methylase subunit